MAVAAGVALSAGDAFADPSAPGSTTSTGGDNAKSAPNVGADPSSDAVRSVRDAGDKAWRDVEETSDKEFGALGAQTDAELARLQARQAAIDRLRADRQEMLEAASADEAAALEAMTTHQSQSAADAHGDAAAHVPLGPNPTELQKTFTADRTAMAKALADESAAIGELGKTAAGDPGRWAAVSELGTLNGQMSATFDTESADVQKAMERAAVAEAQGEETDAMVKEMADSIAEVRQKLQELQQAEQDRMVIVTRA